MAPFLARLSVRTAGRPCCIDYGCLVERAASLSAARQQHSIAFHHLAAIRREPARPQLAPPSPWLPVDGVEIVASGIVLAGRRFRRRRHTDHRYPSILAIKPHQGMSV